MLAAVMQKNTSKNNHFKNGSNLISSLKSVTIDLCESKISQKLLLSLRCNSLTEGNGILKHQQPGLGT
jgi:hypothetical protein